MKSIVLSFALLALLSGCSSSDPTSSSAGPGTKDGSSTPGATNGGTTANGGSTAGAPTASAKFFLPTGAVADNTAAPVVLVDSKGTVHSVYPAFIKGGAYYAVCGVGCTGADTTKVVKFDTDDTVNNAMLVLDAEDHPRILLSSATKVYWAQCDAGCDQQASWKTSMILDHNGDREVSGHALALNSKGQPRFLMHTFRTYLGIGQKDPVTEWMSCDAGCDAASSWTRSQMQNELMEGSSLHFDANDVAKVAGSQQLKAVYQECASGCGDMANWHGIALGDSFSSESTIVSFKPSQSLALAKDGSPRVAYMGQDENGNRRLVYMACDGDCANDHWRGTVLTSRPELEVGLDLQLTKDDKPRLAYNLDYNIDIATCDDADCAGSTPKWGLTTVEAGSQIPSDEIFLYTNCNVGSWFFHSPSLAIGPDGKYRVGYQARDMSAGWTDQDYSKAGCSAGTDMTWSRLALL